MMNKNNIPEFCCSSVCLERGCAFHRRCLCMYLFVPGGPSRCKRCKYYANLRYSWEFKTSLTSFEREKQTEHQQLTAHTVNVFITTFMFVIM